MAASYRQAVVAALVVVAVVARLPAAGALGVNWGTRATHQLPSGTVVRMLQDNGIRRVKLFDADPGPMDALAGSGIEVMLAIPNNMLDMMTDYGTARDWVHQNVSGYNFDGGVTIKYVAVGNEPFLTTFNGTFLNVTLPALQNIQRALNDAGLGKSIKATVPLNADVYNSPQSSSFPSAGRFRSDIAELMTEIVQFLNQSGAPFTVNIYPFLSLYSNDNFPLDYAFFDGTSSPVVDTGTGIKYENVFDANFDTLVSALSASGVGGLPIVVGEVGWPTDGDKHATTAYAQKFYAGLLRKLAANSGTPLRPNQYIEVYLFSLIDEDAKSVAPGNFERHWGIMRYDGQPKYPMDLSGQGQNTALVAARGVQYLPRQWCVVNPNAPDMSKIGDSVTYACTFSDCTSLGYGSSCNGLDAVGNASYAFNMYFQVQNQVEGSCDFQGLAVPTANNPSTEACNFTIQITPSAAGRRRRRAPVATTVLLLLVLNALLQVVAL
ncbi:Glucan endo-1,3-beta-glucosidase 8 [Dichanthelium oligosanthes]|uniref:glucan endo-1,3-beta-D-glucosidase n=1 Tax=Dichanthelium oligosanthes TaxID=888268 RepID=A0A1E5V0Q5_9POAL|nr:Glucan endo-1,3-beta-glucosidase 8 [Dichanthelium oligosanthes]